jgi:hypothetical protein
MVVGMLLGKGGGRDWELGIKELGIRDKGIGNWE